MLRIGKYIAYKGKIITHFHHLNCAFTLFEKARHPDNFVKDLSELDGIESVADTDRKILAEAIEKGNEKRKLIPGDDSVINARKLPKGPTPAARKKKLAVRTEPAIKIMFANADQLTTPKKDELLLRIQKHKPLIVALTEAKPKNSTKERLLIDYELENYSLHPVNLDCADPGRGIAVYIHKSVEKSVADITTAVKFQECCLIEIRLRGGDLMLFAWCYRSPTQSPTDDNK